MIQPCIHQGSIIQNCTQGPETMATSRKRAYASYAGEPLESTSKRQHLESTTSAPAALHACMMYDLAFRDPPSVAGDTGGTRGTALQQSDCNVYTAFNERKFDPERPPQFVGLVDNSAKPTLNGSLQSPQLPVAIKGTRSTHNTSKQTIHNGDHVYWDYPQTDPAHMRPDRPSITGVPDDKLVAITRGLPANYLSSLKLDHLCLGIRDANEAATNARIRALKLPVFLEREVTVAVFAGQTALTLGVGNAAFDGAGQLTAEAQRLYPRTAARMRRGGVLHGLGVPTVAAAIVAEASDVIQATLKEREIGIATNVSLSSRQLDLYIRGG